MNIVIFGKGFVGSATAKIFNDLVTFYDPMKGLIVEDFSKFNYAIICVPTPEVNGSLDYTAVLESLTLLKEKEFQGIIVIRSTCNPIFLDTVSKTFNNVIHWPEFLREKSSIDDALNPTQVILGGQVSLTVELEKTLKSLGYAKDVVWCLLDIKSAAMIKIGINTALAAKVSLFNAIYDACEKTGANWNSVRNGITRDSRIGSGHSLVPGHDGERGFGGSCLPKDIAEFNSILGDNEFINSVISYNKTLRE